MSWIAVVCRSLYWVRTHFNCGGPTEQKMGTTREADERPKSFREAELRRCDGVHQASGL